MVSTTFPRHVVDRDSGSPQNTVWTYHVVTQSVCVPLVSILFILRCFIRLGLGRMKRQWLLEDCFIASATILSVIINKGGGLHVWDLKLPQIRQILHYLWIHSVIYGPFVMTIKLSILLAYLRLLVPTRRSPLWYTVQTSIAFILIFYMATTFVKIFMCNPIPRAWDKAIPGHCGKFPVLLLYTGVFNIISDILLVVIPLRTIWALKMSVKRKMAVCAVFAIGIIAPVSSILGFVWRLKNASHEDPTHDQSLIILWAEAEMTTGIICICLPTLPILFRRPPRAVTENSYAKSSSNRSQDTSDLYRSQRKSGLYNDSYFELDDVSQSHERKDGVVTKVKAGRPLDEESNPGSDVICTAGWQHRKLDITRPSGVVKKYGGNERKASGIIRTVEIEQEGNLNDSESPI
ncbi:hypothetical protein GQ43DRAFT_373488 [Delitschia confertaspora ATCC 74209]|uniref:Rhodopsin domain-containing protein n=1 Tax=Delitschia confertaspora ATCC 74209 TaxID=1513339 RepID=A0A9P4JNX4_9PLEO|nr:hypothetical protein GQ43DRAFT_373488 [Delitschia confertaspora ATCC 74209]